MVFGFLCNFRVIFFFGRQVYLKILSWYLSHWKHFELFFSSLHSFVVDVVMVIFKRKRLYHELHGCCPVAIFSRHVMCTEVSKQCICCFCWLGILMFRQSIRHVIWTHSNQRYAMPCHPHPHLHRPHFTHLHSFLVVHSICIAFSFIHTRLLPAAIDVMMTLILLPVLLNLFKSRYPNARFSPTQTIRGKAGVRAGVHGMKHFYLINAIILFMDGC